MTAVDDLRSKSRIFYNDQKRTTLLGVKVKIKVQPTVSHEGPEGKQVYSSSTLSLNSAQGRGVLSTPSPAALRPERESVTIVQKSWWAPDRSGCLRKMSPPRSIPGTFSP